MKGVKVLIGVKGKSVTHGNSVVYKAYNSKKMHHSILKEKNSLFINGNIGNIGNVLTIQLLLEQYKCKGSAFSSCVNDFISQPIRKVNLYKRDYSRKICLYLIKRDVHVYYKNSLLHSILPPNLFLLFFITCPCFKGILLPSKSRLFFSWCW